MKKSAIMQMYFGERGNYEDVPRSNKYRRLLNTFLDNDAAFRSKLEGAPELLQMYEDTKKSLEELNGEAAENHYLEGFRFGLLIGLDAAQEPCEE